MIDLELNFILRVQCYLLHMYDSLILPPSFHFDRFRFHTSPFAFWNLFCPSIISLSHKTYTKAFLIVIYLQQWLTDDFFFVWTQPLCS